MDRLEEIIQELRAFVADRDWQQFHDPKNLAMAIGSEAGELLAEYRWVSNADADAHSRSPEPRARIAAEAADIAIALLLFCDRIGLDPIDTIKNKLARNRVNYPVDLSRGRSERPSQTAADGVSDPPVKGKGEGSERIICGVDACPGGWVTAMQRFPTGNTEVKVFRTVTELIDQELPAVVAIDIPIGLPDKGSRSCDVEARHLLGKRGSAVFPAPLRPVLAASCHAEASRLRDEIEGKRVSIQAWSIVPKIREVDEVLQRRPDLRGRIREVHPEVCFYFMANRRVMAHKKKSSAGRDERLKLLATHLGDAIPRCVEQKPRRCREDDALDAFASLWTAQRIVRGDARTLPKDPEFDSNGLPMQITA